MSLRRPRKPQGLGGWLPRSQVTDARPCKLSECTEDCYKGRCRKERERIIAKRQARLAEHATGARPCRALMSDTFPSGCLLEAGHEGDHRLAPGGLPPRATSTRVPEMRRRIRFISTDREQERVKESRSAGIPRTCVHTMADAIEEYVNGCGDTWYTDDAIEAALRAARAAGFIEDARE